MRKAQIGQPVKLLADPMLTGGPSQVIKYEDSDDWTFPDYNIVKSIRLLVFKSEASRAEVIFTELIKRLRTETMIDEDYLIKTVPKLLRVPPDADGKIKGFTLI